MSKSGLRSDPSAIFARNIDWNLFKVFNEIVRCGGITAAAKSLNRKQPSVSAALQRLESHLGATLCIRTSRGIKLTINGDNLFGACQAMYGSVQHMPRAASALRGDIGGTVSLRVISNLHQQPMLTRIFDDFHVSYPAIEIKLDVAPWREVLASLRKGEVELAVGFDDAPDGQNIRALICEEPQQLYCGPKHPLFGSESGSPDLLEQEPFVITQDEPIPYGKLRDRYGLGRQIGGSADNLFERMWLVQLGVGIGFLPRPVVEASSFASSLWPLLRPSDAPICNIYLMANANTVRSAPAQLLLDVAMKHLEPNQAVLLGK